MSAMMTRWGAALDANAVLQEYPRPQMVRESYVNLNGYWNYAITEGGAPGAEYDGRILVPFSPEAPLSGVGRSLAPGQTLWYRRALPCARQAGLRTLLHFGAVDQTARVYVNGALAAEHTGGYTAFSADISALLTDGENILTVAVQDATEAVPLSRGKQKTKRGGIWYTPQSGIWQTVWMEHVPEEYISALRITPDAAHGQVQITVLSDAERECCIVFQGRRIEGRTNSGIMESVDEPELWSPESPRSWAQTRWTAILPCATWA